MSAKSPQATREQLEIILEHVADGITLQDPNGNLIYANLAAAKLLGYADSGQVLSASLSDIMNQFEIYDERHRALSVSQLPGRQAIAAAVDSARVVGFRRGSQDALLWSLVRASCVYDDSGKVKYVINVFQDITQLKNTELRLKEANKRMTKLLEDILKTDEP